MSGTLGNECVWGNGCVCGWDRNLELARPIWGGRGGSVAGEFPVITELEAESLAWPPAGGYLDSPHGCMYLSHLRHPLSR